MECRVDIAMLAGRWEAVAMYEFYDGKWHRAYRYGPGDWQLEFRPGGTLAERSSDDPGAEETLTSYGFGPDSVELWIDRSDYEPDGFTAMCLEDRYRIVRLSSRWLLLHDLSDLGCDEDGHAEAYLMISTRK